MKSRKWTSEEKFAVVMQGLKGEKSVSEIYKENGLSKTMYYKWRDAFLEGGKKALESGNKSYDRALEAEIEKLQKIIGKQAIEIEVLKKTDELFQKR
jgi:transposase-like protein